MVRRSIPVSHTLSPWSVSNKRDEALGTAVAPKEFELYINLNLGKANAVMYAADLTEACVDYNKGDVTDPTTLGG